MLKPGKSQPTSHTGPYQPGVVIAAEIAFAALLLYLTNHPINQHDLTQASNSDTESAPTLVASPTTKVAVVASSFDTSSQTLLK